MLVSLEKPTSIVTSKPDSFEGGRSPTEAEFRNHLNKKYHKRIAPIAFKGWKDHGKRNYLADEELVVTAVLTAILTGRETVVLTWDTDIFEQFTKLLELLLAHYVCLRFGEVYNRGGCPMFVTPIPEDWPVFRGSSIEHILISEKEVNALPPDQPRFVNTYCMLLGNNCLEPKLSIASFCLEKEMLQLLGVKASTGGLNTPHFQGRNMVVGFDPKAEGRPNTFFALGSEAHINYEGLRLSQNDFDQATRSDTLHRKFYYN